MMASSRSFAGTCMTSLSTIVFVGMMLAGVFDPSLVLVSAGDGVCGSICQCRFMLSCGDVRAWENNHHTEIEQNVCEEGPQGSCCQSA